MAREPGCLAGIRCARRLIPPPRSQGNRIWVNKYESLTERTESKSSEIPVLFTHMRLPCPRSGGGSASEASRGWGTKLAMPGDQQDPHPTRLATLGGPPSPASRGRDLSEAPRDQHRVEAAEGKGARQRRIDSQGPSLVR